MLSKPAKSRIPIPATTDYQQYVHRPTLLNYLKQPIEKTPIPTLFEEIEPEPPIRFLVDIKPILFN
jgi:hypothetical protein